MELYLGENTKIYWFIIYLAHRLLNKICKIRKIIGSWEILGLDWSFFLVEIILVRGVFEDVSVDRVNLSSSILLDIALTQLFEILILLETLSELRVEYRLGLLDLRLLVSIVLLVVYSLDKSSLTLLR